MAGAGLRYARDRAPRAQEIARYLLSRGLDAVGLAPDAERVAAELAATPAIPFPMD